MTSDHFFKIVNTYTHLSEVSKHAWHKLLREESYRKTESFVELGRFQETDFITKKIQGGVRSR